MTGIVRFSLWTAVAALSLAAADGKASAATPYDGPWHVAITTVRGTCSSGVGFGLLIRGGLVYGYSSDLNVSGRVSRSGAVQVSLSSGQQHASGSGLLRGSSGYGSWRGVGTQGSCSGSWSASRG
jgi:hypothetical protein